MSALGAHSIDDMPRPDALLRVERSARGLRWVDRLDPARENMAMTLAQRGKLPDIVARVLAARGAEPEALDEFLNPTLKSLMPDPSKLRDMDQAAERFARAIRDREHIAVFGDYDVDGGSSVALIRRFLAAHGHDAHPYIPDRMLEGYGPNITAFEQLAGDGAQLIVTVDCGTVAHQPIARARELGTDVIVLDHHQADEHLPDALAVVNPNRLDDISAQGHLAACGVVFLFLVATARVLRQSDWYGDGKEPPDLMQWLDLVALATVCDVVPLTGFNRALVNRGLEVMRMRRNAGLRALADVIGLAAAPTTYHLGFVLGPRLNAGGRIGRSDLAAQLLTTEDDAKANEIAATLHTLNAERRAMQDALEEEALVQAAARIEQMPDASVAIAHGEGWHKGVVGLVASHLVERFRRPALAVAWESDGPGSGSARSVAGVDMGAAIRAAVEEGHLERGGGHEMAAGFSVSRNKADAFFEFVEHALHDQVITAREQDSLKIDGALMAASATPDFLDLLDRAGPFGAGNPQPRFAFAAHRCTYAKIVGEKHVRCTLSASDGSRLDAVAFNAAATPVGEILLNSDGMPIHVAGRLRRSEWGGRKKIELHIEDAADPRRAAG
ncbi:MAG: single-stranded-DNA-specific exonuclease RecJ [Hyphomicrobiaceae bacterium]|nr:single-stranded-DNA-specific exonuclease RecJ [Hyphomicrobiaceae bacterium]